MSELAVITLFTSYSFTVARSVVPPQPNLHHVYPPDYLCNTFALAHLNKAYQQLAQNLLDVWQAQTALI